MMLTKSEARAMRTLLMSSAEGTTDRDASVMPKIPENVWNQDIWEKVEK